MLSDLCESKRLLALENYKTAKTGTRGRLLANVALTAKSTSHALKPGMRRLLQFVELLSVYDRAPWANIVFNVNAAMIRRLTHTHLSIIAGTHYAAEKTELEGVVAAPDHRYRAVPA